MTGTITNIQRLSIGDGPGIRSTVFFKGCRFRCAWCHNPETWTATPQLRHLPDRCIGCSSCIEVCPSGALAIKDGAVSLDRNLCNMCRRCAEVCPSGALSMTGRKVSVREVMDELLMDRPFYIESGGGVTLSGGEPLLQFDFIKELLAGCKDAGIDTAIETTLDTDKSKLEALLPLVDSWMVDLKTMDDRLHLEYTGVSNRKTLDNLAFLSSRTGKITVRTPVVPGVNDSTGCIESICLLLETLGITRYELLPFHDLGFDKYTSHGIHNRMAGTGSLSRKDLKALEGIVAAHGLNDDYNGL